MKRPLARLLPLAVPLLLAVALGLSHAQESDENKDSMGIGHVDNVPAIDLTRSPQAETSASVMAGTHEWTSSGALLKKGNTYRVVASGQWHMGGFCGRSGPTGQGTENPLCFRSPLARPVVSGHELGALVGKVGLGGKPFYIGEGAEFTAQDEGMLYFRSNNRDWAFNGTGALTAKVSLADAPRAPAPLEHPAASADNPRISEVERPPQRPTPAPAASSAPAAQESQATQRWAVVIGVSRYADSRVPSLRYAGADAKAFYHWLVSPNGGRYSPSRVRLLVDSHATAANMRDALFNWLRQAIEEDVVVIYFAGHGSPDSPDSPQNLYLLPYDTRYDSIASTGFPMWDIETALKRFIKAKRVVVIADACHAGGVGGSFDIARRSTPEANRISSGIQNLSTIGEGIAVLSAADDRQLSAEGPKFGGGHGVFTYYLLEGLQGQADYNNDGQVTMGELIPYLSESVRRATLNAQSPTIAGKFDPALSIGQ